MPRRKKPNPFADLPGDLRRAVAADPVPATILAHAFEGSSLVGGICGRLSCGRPLSDPVHAKPVIILSHAFAGTPGNPCDACTLSFSHPVHAHDKPRKEVGVRVAPISSRSPVLPRLDALRDVLRMLQQALAYSGATDRERCEREELLRTAVDLLRSELGADLPDAYAKSVAAQTARIDAALNEEGRKQRKR